MHTRWPLLFLFFFFTLHTICTAWYVQHLPLETFLFNNPIFPRDAYPRLFYGSHVCEPGEPKLKWNIRMLFAHWEQGGRSPLLACKVKGKYCALVKRKVSKGMKTTHSIKTTSCCSAVTFIYIVLVCWRGLVECDARETVCVNSGIAWFFLIMLCYLVQMTASCWDHCCNDLKQIRLLFSCRVSSSRLLCQWFLQVKECECLPFLSWYKCCRECVIGANWCVCVSVCGRAVCLCV